MATLLDFVGITKLRDAWPKWKANVVAVNNQLIGHVAGTSDKHLTSHITNDSAETGTTTADAINTNKAKVAAHVAGAADKHASQSITYAGSFTSKENVKDALDQAKTEINTIVVNASVDPEVALARESSVKSETFATLGARLEESEQDLVTYKAETTLYLSTPQGESIVSDLQNALNAVSASGLHRTIKARGNFLMDAPVTIPSNVTIDFRDATLTTTLSGLALPASFLIIDGDNVTIMAKMILTIEQQDNRTVGRFIGFSATKSTFDNITITRCEAKYVSYCVFAFGKTFTNLSICDNTFVGLVRDIYLNKCKGNIFKANSNYFPIQRNWTVPTRFEHSIAMSNGSEWGVESITDSVYENEYFKNVEIANNVHYKPSKRVYFITNAVDVRVKDNTFEAVEGYYTDPNTTHDVITLEYVRDFYVTRNKIGASGENGIDILGGCRRGKVCKNILSKIHTNGIHIGLSDKYVDGFSALSPAYEIPEDIDINDNTIESGETCYYISVGKNIFVEGDRLRLNGTGSRLHLVVSPNLTFMNSNSELYIKNIKFKNIQRSDKTLLNKPMIYVVTLTGIAWGTIELCESFAVESDWIDFNALQYYEYVHGKGLYNRAEVYFYIDPLLLATYGTTATNFPIDRLLIKGMYTTPSDGKIKGVLVSWKDIYRVSVKGGDYLLDAHQIPSGTGGNLGNITSGKIKIVTY